MTAILASDRPHHTRAEQLKQLRRQMAAVAGKVGSPRHAHTRSHTGPDDLLPESETKLPIPQLLADVLPDALPRGTVAVLSGARSLPLSMVAAVTAAGGNAAIVGQPDIGLLAAVEMGADLSRLAVIPDPGADPVEVAAVLMDGMDLVVLALGGRSVPQTRARAVVARAHQKGCTLLITDGDWQGASVRLEARVCGYETTASEPGFGRIRQGAARRLCTGTAYQADTGRGSSHGLPSTGDLVYGLASGRRGSGRRPARDRPGRRHAGQPGDRLLIGCPFGGSAARITATRGGGPLPPIACRDSRLRPRRPLLRRGYRGGRRSGAPRRGAAARAVGVAGARGGPLFRIRTAGRRAADRRSGRSRCRMSGRGRRPAVHRGLCRPCRSSRRTGRRRAVPVGAVDPATRHRAQPVRSRTGRARGSAVADGNSDHRTVRRIAAHRRGFPVRRRRGKRAPVRPRRAGTRTVRA